MVKKATDSAIREALKVNKCKANVRPYIGEERGKKVYSVCGKEWIGKTPCPNKDVHLLPFKTGFCSNGWCEGTKAVDWKGNPAPTCQFFVTCPCKCHDDLDRLFALTDSERILVESSGYAPPQRSYWMPSDDPLPPLSSPSVTDAPVILESPAPDRVPATVARPFTATPTGRAARGELEAWVKEECDAWLIDEPGYPCTPTYLAAEIARSKGITPPSVGAISAVFERWIKLGFAVVEKKPTRFVKYTEDGIKLGLERMKVQAKREKRSARSSALRGYR